jgi:hypothetical protein
MYIPKPSGDFPKREKSLRIKPTKPHRSVGFFRGMIFGLFGKLSKTYLAESTKKISEIKKLIHD